MSIPIVTFVGRSGAGKTTLLVKVIFELKQRGYRVATIKHHPHGGFQVDRPGKDSWRHAQAGSQHVVIVAPDKVASYRRMEKELPLEEIAACIQQVDIILVEGYKQARLPAFEVVRAEVGVELVGRSEYRIGVAADVPLEVDVPRFSLHDVGGISDFLEERILVAGGAGGGLGRGVVSAAAEEEAVRLSRPAGIQPLSGVLDTAPSYAATAEAEGPGGFELLGEPESEVRSEVSRVDVPVFCVVGRANSGRTTLLEKLIGELKGRGHRVGTIKHHSHPGFEVDQPGKDTWRHARAGSVYVVLAAPDMIVSIRQADQEPGLNEITATMSDVDVVLTEGYLKAGQYRIEVVRAARSREPICGPEELLALVTDVKVSGYDVPQFGLEDAASLADLIEGLMQL